MNKIVLSKNIKSVRKSAKKSQFDIAYCLCVNRATVAKWETGRVIPSLGTIEKNRKIDKLQTI